MAADTTERKIPYSASIDWGKHQNVNNGVCNVSGIANCNSKLTLTYECVDPTIAVPSGQTYNRSYTQVIEFD